MNWKISLVFLRKCLSLPYVTYSHFHNNYVKIVSTGTLQTKIKKTMIKEKHLIRIIFYVNEETRLRPSFQEYTLDICQMNLL